MSAIQTDFLTVPYKGTGPAMNDLIGGQVDFMCDQTTSTTGQIKGGKVKAYGVTSAQRIPSLPDVPTLDEQGLKGANVGIWHGLYAPKGTPKPIIDKLVAALQAALKDPVTQQKFADLGAVSFPPDKQTPQALQAHLKAEIAKWAPIIKKAGVYPDLKKCPPLFGEGQTALGGETSALADVSTFARCVPIPPRLFFKHLAFRVTRRAGRRCALWCAQAPKRGSAVASAHVLEERLDALAIRLHIRSELCHGPEAHRFRGVVQGRE
jgi:hypothetical protein